MAKKKKKVSGTFDKHQLYEAAVQAVDVDLPLFQRVFKKVSKRPMKTIREDFCGTAQFAAEWVRLGKNHEAWGIDLDKPTLDGAKQYRIGPLSEDEKARVHLVHENVLNVTGPKVDLVAALNFSYSVFKDRKTLLEYFTRVRESLVDDGVFIVDVWGGPTSMQITSDKRDVAECEDIYGGKIPAFKYEWDQSYFNAVDNHIVCHIHFKLPGQQKIKKAFTYDWRLWGLPELRDVMIDAGFISVDAWFDGWDEDEEDTDGNYQPVTEYEEMDAWVGYLVATKK